MAIPDFQTLMLPVLRQLATGGEQAPSSVRAAVAPIFKLSEKELAALLPSGRQAIFTNRVAWALGYLKQAGLAESPRRGSYRITQRGTATLHEPLERIDITIRNISLCAHPLALESCLAVSRHADSSPYEPAPWTSRATSRMFVDKTYPCIQTPGVRLPTSPRGQ